MILVARRASCHVTNAFSTRLKLIWQKVPGVNGLSEQLYLVINKFRPQNVWKQETKISSWHFALPFVLCKIIKILFNITIHGLKIEKIHTPPVVLFCVKTLCQFSLIASFKSFGLWEPHPHRISIDLLWCGLGFCPELHILWLYSANTEGMKWFHSRLEQPLFKITESFLLSLGESKHLERVCIIARHGPMKIDPQVVVSLFEKVLNMRCLSVLVKSEKWTIFLSS